MCGGGKTPNVPQTPAPAPTPMASDPNAQATEQQRINKASKLRQGVYSTVKTTPQGASGAGPELSTGANLQQKKALGA